jgi:hypothetical protein
MNAQNFILRSAASVLLTHRVGGSVVFDLNGRRYKLDEIESKLGLKRIGIQPDNGQQDEAQNPGHS